MSRGLVACALLMGLLLSACSGGSEDDEAGTSASASWSDATEAEVASVITGYESGWREVISEAGECRFTYVGRAPGPRGKRERRACYTREVATGVTAHLAISELTAVGAPESLSMLVDETKAALQAVSDVDLEAVCGPSTSDIRHNDGCSRALGDRFVTYLDLEAVLDMWTPYLDGRTADGSTGVKGDEESGSASEPAPAQPKAKPEPVAVEAAGIVKEFEENELAADNKYKGKALKITGVVNKIDTELFDSEKYVLRLGGGGEFELLEVSCYGMSTEQLSTLAKGDSVTVVGKFNDGGDLGVTVTDCALA